MTLTALVVVGCQPQSGSADRRSSPMQDAMPPVDHHPPPRTPEN